MISAGQISRFRCRVCLGETNHETLFERAVVRSYLYSDQEAEQYGDSYEEEDHYALLQCRGCEDIRLRVSSQVELHGQHYGSVATYPPDQVRHLPEWIHTDLYVGPNILKRPEHNPGLAELLTDIREHLREIYASLGIGSHRLSMMGIRALVERIMIQEVGDRHSFENNIKAFFEKGYVAPAQQEMFRSHIEAGHAVMHRNWKPTRDDVMTVLDILESLIKTTYVDRKKAAEVAARIPPRVPRMSSRPTK